MSREGRIMKQKEYRTVRITRHMRAGMLAAGLLLPLVAGAATSGGLPVSDTHLRAPEPLARRGGRLRGENAGGGG
ncbi:hypothetical protein C9F08_04180, partial [Salmonella enterica subsp. enterica serovar Enteritidis]